MHFDSNFSMCVNDTIDWKEFQGSYYAFERQRQEQVCFH